MKLISPILSVVLSFTCCTPKAPTYTVLHPGIFQINNQYFYSEKVNTYLIELEDKILLFDIPSYSKDIEKFITSFGKPVYAILSHGSCGIPEGTKWQKEIGLKVYAHIADKNHPWLSMKPDVFFSTMPEFGKNVQVIHTPGHSAGAICVLEKTSRSLFTGDTFYGSKNGGVRDFSKEKPASYENPSARIESCKNLLMFDFDNVYPFHYEIIHGNAKTKLAEYLSDK